MTAFDYSLRVSHRARYARLQIKPFVGLEVVIPARFPRSDVPLLLRQHRHWISDQLQKHRLEFEAPELPTEVFIAFTGSTQQLGSVVDDAGSYRQNLLALRNWVRNQAWQLLPPLLQATSEQTRLAYKKITIRSQKTRWGSCSSRGTISLNDQLLFVPRETAQYLMVHELCHTRHMNHSAEFWRLVESHCADYRFHERILSRAREHIPAWYQYSLYRGG